MTQTVVQPGGTSSAEVAQPLREDIKLDGIATTQDSTVPQPISVQDAARLREAGRLDEAVTMLRQIVDVDPHAVGTLAELARVRGRQGDHAAAVAAFETAVRANPNHIGLKTELAGELRESGRLDEAVALLSGILDAHPHDFSALAQLGRVRRGQGDRGAALAAFEGAVAGNPSHLGLRVELAGELRVLGRLDEAESVLRDVIEREPKQFDALIGLGHIARRRNDRANSLAMFEAAALVKPDHAGVKAELARGLLEIGRLDEAEIRFLKILESRPQQIDALVGLAQIARSRGDRLKSLAMFEAAAIVDPKHMGVKLQAAADLRELGRLDDAEALVRQVLDRETANFEALVGLGHVLRRRGDRSGSLAAFEAAALIDQSHIGVGREVVIGLRDLGRVKEAAVRLEQLLAANSGNVAALAALGSLRLEQFRLDDAELLFRRAISVAPGGGDLAALLGLGYVARRRADRDKALVRFEAARAANPDHIGAALESAVELRDLGRVEEARTIIQSVLTRHPGDVQAGMQMAHLYRKVGDRKTALSLFAAIHERQPNKVQPLVEMAVEQRALGHPKESEALLQRALALDSAHVGALEHLAGHHFLAEDFEGSLMVCRRVIAANPHRLGSYIQASRALAELGRKDEAIRLLDEACQMVGPAPEIRAMRVTFARQDRDWRAARALLAESKSETHRYAVLWTHRVALAITTGDYDGAASALPVKLPATTHEASQVHLFRGQIAEAHWQLAAAAVHYADAIALEPNDSGAHAHLARTSLKLLDLEACRRNMHRMTELVASSNLLREQSLNVSQTHVGQLLDEFSIDKAQLEALRCIRALPVEQQITPLRELVAGNPDHTASAIMLLIAMREAGVLVRPRAHTPDGSFKYIPRRIVQYWDEVDPPPEISALMTSWREHHPEFQYIRFDDHAAQTFLAENKLQNVLLAYKRAREPAQRADIFRLAYLAVHGGFYADADDRCLAGVGCFIPPEAHFVSFQEDFGTLGNNFLAVTPRHPVILRALQLGTTAINRGDADFLWLSTGPGLLTRAFAQLISRHDNDLDTLGAVILDMGSMGRNIGIHCPVRYKKTARHWSRSAFGRK